MKRVMHNNRFSLPLLIGLIVGLASFVVTVQIVGASTTNQTDEQAGEEPEQPVQLNYTAEECQECHLDVTEHWIISPHANAYNDPYFQERWVGMGEPGECLACHTTNYQQSTGEYDFEGIACQSCHGDVSIEHPPEPVPILADTEYCGSCHPTTLSEWRLTGHATSDVGCNDCHDPHSQDPLFEVADEMCINCHEDTMGDYLEGTHEEQEIGCVDCHALVIPPEVIPDDGIVPTGHAFTITPATCVACHTDSLHAGFSLPGYEHGASVAVAQRAEAEGTAVEEAEPEAEEETAVVEEAPLTAEQQLQALEAAVASQNVTMLFQGGVVGLVLGSTTAWFVANNVRSRAAEQSEEDAEMDEEDEEEREDDAEG